MLTRLLFFGALILLLAGYREERAPSPRGDAAPIAGTLQTPLVRADTLQEIRPAADTLAAVAQPADNLATALMALATAISAYTEQAATASPVVSLQEAGKTAQHLGLRVFWALVVLTLTAFLIKGLVYVLILLSERNAKQRLLFKRLVPILRILLWALAFFIVLRGIFQLDPVGSGGLCPPLLRFPSQGSRPAAVGGGTARLPGAKPSFGRPDPVPSK